MLNWLQKIICLFKINSLQKSSLRKNSFSKNKYKKKDLNKCTDLSNDYHNENARVIVQQYMFVSYCLKLNFK